MQTTDTFVQDLRVYIKKEDEKPLLGPSFYKAVLDGTLSNTQPVTLHCRLRDAVSGHPLALWKRGDRGYNFLGDGMMNHVPAVRHDAQCAGGQLSVTPDGLLCCLDNTIL